MPDRPDALELLEAVRGFLETEVAKGATDPRLRFREAPSGAPPAEEALALSWELCRRIRDGTSPSETAGAVRRIVEGKLAAASPRYLQKKR